MDNCRYIATKISNGVSNAKQIPVNAYNKVKVKCVNVKEKVQEKVA